MYANLSADPKCLELCGAIWDRKYALHAVTTYFKIFCLYARAEDYTPIWLPGERWPTKEWHVCRTSDRKSPKVNPPNRPRRGGSYVCLCCPVYAVNCDSAVSCDAHKSCYESTMIHKLAYFLSNEVANVLAGTILNADFKSTLAMSAPFPNADNMWMASMDA